MEELPAFDNLPTDRLSNEPSQYQREQFDNLKVGKYYYIEFKRDNFHKDFIAKVLELNREEQTVLLDLVKDRSYKKNFRGQPVSYTEYLELLGNNQTTPNRLIAFFQLPEFGPNPVPGSWEHFGVDRMRYTKDSINSNNDDSMQIHFYIPKQFGGGRRRHKTRRGLVKRRRITRKRRAFFLVKIEGSTGPNRLNRIQR